VLFIDDEPAILKGLRNRLHRWQARCHLVFAAGPDPALAELRAAPFDVVVSDVRMPGMNGIRLLEWVKEHHPHAIRIILSGQADRDLLAGAVGIVHQVLAKPCAAGTLEDVLERALGVPAFLARGPLRELILGLEALPSPPSWSTNPPLAEALREPASSPAAIARLVSRDVALTARLLKLVNFAFLGTSGGVSNLAEAVRLLGTPMIRSMAGSLDETRSAESQGIHAHAHLVAQIAGRQASDPRVAATAFTAAILHGIGELLLAARLPDAHARALAALEAAEARGPYEGLSVERSVNGFTHTELGGFLLSLWGVPRALVDAATCRLTQESSPELRHGLCRIAHPPSI
jgi:HD-like signal output (HDOD) protein